MPFRVQFNRRSSMLVRVKEIGRLLWIAIKELPQSLQASLDELTHALEITKLNRTVFKCHYCGMEVLGVDTIIGEQGNRFCFPKCQDYEKK